VAPHVSSGLHPIRANLLPDQRAEALLKHGSIDYIRNLNSSFLIIEPLKQFTRYARGRTRSFDIRCSVFDIRCSNYMSCQWTFSIPECGLPPLRQKNQFTPLLLSISTPRLITFFPTLATFEIGYAAIFLRCIPNKNHAHGDDFLKNCD